MKKRIISIVAVVLVVAMLSVVLVACADAQSYKEKLEKKDYMVTVFEGKNEDGSEDATIEFTVVAVKASLGASLKADAVTITKFAKADDAKNFESKMKSEEKSKNVVRSGKIVFVGTEQGVKDAK